MNSGMENKIELNSIEKSVEEINTSAPSLFPCMTITINASEVFKELEDDYFETEGSFLNFTKILKAKGLTDREVIKHWIYFYSMNY